MNEQLTQFNISGDAANSSINPALISMQMQALQESLRRLLNQDDSVLTELPDSEQDEAQVKPEC